MWIFWHLEINVLKSFNQKKKNKSVNQKKRETLQRGYFGFAINVFKIVNQKNSETLQGYLGVSRSKFSKSLIMKTAKLCNVDI